MLSLEEIRRINADAGMSARSLKKEPFLLKHEAQLDNMPPFPFPYIGDMADDVDGKYERVDSLFADSSGFGSPGEPALTISQLLKKLRVLLRDNGPLRLAIESCGEFQVYIGVWKEGGPA